MKTNKKHKTETQCAREARGRKAATDWKEIRRKVEQLRAVGFTD